MGVGKGQDINVYIREAKLEAAVSSMLAKVPDPDCSKGLPDFFNIYKYLEEITCQPSKRSQSDS